MRGVRGSEGENDTRYMLLSSLSNDEGEGGMEHKGIKALEESG